MKKLRHKCFICKQKCYEVDMLQVVHIGKNRVAYKGWVCKNGTGKMSSKNRPYWNNGLTAYCESKFKDMDNSRVDVHIPGANKLNERPR